MKLRSHLWDRLCLAILRYFGYEPENIRQAVIIPGRYYYYNGYILKAVPLSRDEQLERQTLCCDLIKNTPSANVHSPETESELEEITSGCYVCPFFERWPCPLNLTLDDHSKLCHHYKFVIIQSNYNA